MATHDNKVILVTGASSGMGKEFARALLAEGHTVYVAARRLSAMEDLRSLGAIPLAMDVTDEQQVAEAFAQIKANHGGLDVLINNAGFGLLGAVEDIPINDARYQFEVNLFGLARVTQHALPAMRERRRGTIINISSMGGKIYTPLGSWYHATKHALEGWSDCLRLELQPFNINVVIIQPGVIETAFGDVVTQPLLAYSGQGTYASMAQQVAKMMQKNYKPGGASKPQVVTELVLRAIHSRKPKTRYAAGKYAKPMLLMRRWLSDRAFDRIVTATVNQ